MTNFLLGVITGLILMLFMIFLFQSIFPIFTQQVINKIKKLKNKGAGSVDVSQGSTEYAQEHEVKRRTFLGRLIHKNDYKRKNKK